jgi:hypothetical protein
MLSVARRIILIIELFREPRLAHNDLTGDMKRSRRRGSPSCESAFRGFAHASGMVWPIRLVSAEHVAKEPAHRGAQPAQKDRGRSGPAAHSADRAWRWISPGAVACRIPCDLEPATRLTESLCALYAKILAALRRRCPAFLHTADPSHSSRTVLLTGLANSPRGEKLAMLRPLLRRAPGRKSQAVRATRPVERIARQALIDRRDRCMAEIAHFWSEPENSGRLFEKARADILRTAEWLVGVGKRTAESASCEQWHSTRGHLPTSEKPAPT